MEWINNLFGNWFWNTEKCQERCITTEPGYGFISHQTCDAQYKDHKLPAACDAQYKDYILPSACPQYTGPNCVLREPFQFNPSYNPFETKKW